MITLTNIGGFYLYGKRSDGVEIKIEIDGKTYGHFQEMIENTNTSRETELVEEISRLRLLAEMSDEEVSDIIDSHEEWIPGRVFTSEDIGLVVNYNNQLYEVRQPHTSASHYLPPDVPALYLPVLPDETVDGEEIVAPYQNGKIYSEGERMQWTDGKIYISKINDNVWTPESYPIGWILEE